MSLGGGRAVYSNGTRQLGPASQEPGPMGPVILSASAPVLFSASASRYVFRPYVFSASR